MLRNKTTFWSPHQYLVFRPRTELLLCPSREPPREVSPLRDHRSFDTVHEYKRQAVFRAAPPQAAAHATRKVSEIAASVSCPKRECEHAERREAAAAQTAAKATAAKAAVVEAARQRVAAEQRLADSSSARVHNVMSVSVHI